MASYIVRMSDVADKIEYMLECAKRTGAAASTVSDGTILVLSKTRLRALLEKDESEFAVVFVQNESAQSIVAKN